MRKTALQSVVASRMKEALARSGMSQSEAARRLGRKQGTVNRWLNGTRRPEDEDIVAFATLLGTTAEELTVAALAPSPPLFVTQGRPDLGMPRAADEALRMMVAWLDLASSGDDLATAYDKLGSDGRDLTPEIRQRLRDSDPRVHEDLARLAGASWGDLTEEQKQEVVRKIEAMAKRNRRGR